MQEKLQKILTAAVPALWGIGIGLLIADYGAAEFLNRDMTLIIWAGLTGIAGSVAGAYIGVRGAISAAREQIQANKEELAKQRRIEALRTQHEEQEENLILLDDLKIFLVGVNVAIRRALRRIEDKSAKSGSWYNAYTALIENFVRFGATEPLAVKNTDEK